MAERPQIATPNSLTMDTSDNADLKEIFQGKEVGDRCKLTLELQVMSKRPEEIQFSIEKVISEHGDGYGGEDKEAKADLDHPIMATMRKKNPKARGRTPERGPKSESMGKHNRPPETAVNSEEPWRTSYT